MRSSIALLLVLALLCAATGAQEKFHHYREAAPGYKYSFPRDNFSHPEFQTEWWYYTGNLKAADGHAFGFQVTFFRQGVQRTPAQDSSWVVDDLYLAHAALSAFYSKQGRHSDAVQQALLVCDLDPDDPFSYMAKSLVCQRAGMIREAEDAMAEAMNRQWAARR